MRLYGGIDAHPGVCQVILGICSTSRPFRAVTSEVTARKGRLGIGQRPVPLALPSPTARPRGDGSGGWGVWGRHSPSDS